MGKKYIVRLTAQEREVCQQTLGKLNGGSEKVRRAQILLKADADGPRWTDRQIAEAFSCRTKTVENIRQRCVLDGFEQALERKRRESPPVEKLLDGEQESQVIALRLGPPPRGFANWSLRLLARRVVELGVVESISHETIRRTLKKRGLYLLLGTPSTLKGFSLESEISWRSSGRHQHARRAHHPMGAKGSLNHVA